MIPETGISMFNPIQVLSYQLNVSQGKYSGASAVMTTLLPVTGCTNDISRQCNAMDLLGNAYSAPYLRSPIIGQLILLN